VNVRTLAVLSASVGMMEISAVWEELGISAILPELSLVAESAEKVDGILNSFTDQEYTWPAM
jgi:hypothetical protein